MGVHVRVCTARGKVYMRTRRTGVECVCVCACTCRCADLEERGSRVCAACMCARGGEKQAGFVPVVVYGRVHVYVHRKERRPGVCLCRCTEKTRCVRALRGGPCPQGALLLLPCRWPPRPRPASGQIPCPRGRRVRVCSLSPGGLDLADTEPWTLVPPVAHHRQGQGMGPAAGDPAEGGRGLGASANVSASSEDWRVDRRPLPCT